MTVVYFDAVDTSLASEGSPLAEEDPAFLIVSTWEPTGDSDHY